MRIILIGGAQRSGTTIVQTLVANALDGSPVLPESHLLCDIVHAYKRAKTEWQKTSKFYHSKEDLTGFFRAASEAHLSDIARRYENPKGLVLKDPNFAHVATEVLELIRRAAFILCIRDPRDITASFLKIGQRQAKQQQATRYIKRNIRFICSKINSAYEPAIDGPSTREVVFAKYEEMVTNPRDALVKLATKTGLPLDLARTENLRWLEPEFRHQDAWITELEGRPPTGESIGSFQEILYAEEIAQVERACSELMTRFDYRQDTTGKAKKRPILDRLRRIAK